MKRKFFFLIVTFLLSSSIFLVIIILGFLSGPGADLIPPEYIDKFVAILPGSIYTDIILIYSIPIICFAIYYIISPYLNLFYIKLHQLLYRLFRRPSKYGLAKLGTTVKAGRLFYRALIVSLFAFSIAFVVVELGYADLFRAGMAPPASETVYALNIAEAVFLGTFVICPIVIIVFFPIWQLEDSGVVSYRVFHEDRMPIDVQGVHSIYNNMLLGYAGVSTIISWILLISNIFSTNPELGAALLTPIILIILPFIITGLLAFPIYLYERLFSRTNARVQRKLEKFNFPDIKIPHFEELRE